MAEAAAPDEMDQMLVEGATFANVATDLHNGSAQRSFAERSYAALSRNAEVPRAIASRKRRLVLDRTAELIESEWNCASCLMACARA